jgi:hypothetical protein
LTVSHTFVGSGQSLFDQHGMVDEPPAPPVDVVVPPPVAPAPVAGPAPAPGGSIRSASEHATSATAMNTKNRIATADRRALCTKDNFISYSSGGGREQPHRPRR